MKVLHVIPSLSLKHGGPSFAMPLIARALAHQRVEVDVATTDDDGPGGRISVPLGQRVERDDFGVFYFQKQTRFTKFPGPSPAGWTATPLITIWSTFTRSSPTPASAPPAPPAATGCLTSSAPSAF